jgi:hypothetical protein
MLYQFLILLVTHWIADFVCQTHWQASNKSKNNWALGAHVATYTLILAFFSVIVFGPTLLTGLFIVVNGILHFITDYITSRITSKLWAEQKVHDFFVIVGLDQLIHQVTLAATLKILLT